MVFLILMHLSFLFILLVLSIILIILQFWIFLLNLFLIILTQYFKIQISVCLKCLLKRRKHLWILSPESIVKLASILLNSYWWLVWLFDFKRYCCWLLVFSVSFLLELKYFVLKSCLTECWFHVKRNFIHATSVFSSF